MSLMEDGIHIICLQETKRRKNNLQGELKEHGKSCIWIFYEKYCVLHLPWQLA